MWNYEKRLEFPVNIKRTDPKMAQLIITQYGGPDGELGASMRYLSQRFAMPYKNVLWGANRYRYISFDMAHLKHITIIKF